MAGNAVVFSPTELINQVKIRPKLYDPEYAADRSVKLKLWREVCAALFSDWDTCNKATAYDRVLQIQKKWRSLRDAYNREVRLRKRSGDRKRRVYLHFKKMSFLGGYEGTISSEEEGDAVEREAYLSQVDEMPPQDFEAEPKKKSKRKKRKRQSSDTQEPLEEMEIPMFPVEITDPNSDDTDRYFLLSFLPEMKQLPLNIKMWARAQIANVMQEAVNSHFSGNTKMPPPTEKPLSESEFP